MHSCTYILFCFNEFICPSLRISTVIPVTEIHLHIIASQLLTSAQCHVYLKNLNCCTIKGDKIMHFL
uniref:Uncharacterized protein n=1 Tax=Octopus bimaculoides TaxID=37653 RepID=A0A0L8G6Q7_OCTBM